MIRAGRHFPLMELVHIITKLSLTVPMVSIIIIIDCLFCIVNYCICTGIKSKFVFNLKFTNYYNDSEYRKVNDKQTCFCDYNNNNNNNVVCFI